MTWDTGEQRLLARIEEWTGSRLMGDDCAVLPGQLLASTDSLVEGVHFRRHTISSTNLGWKCMAVNLSDIAAMGGRPRYVLVSINRPADCSDVEIKRIYEGIIDCARTYRTRIAGGDLTASSVLCLTLTVLGTAHETGMALRSGALPGDVIVASGDFGASRAGLYLLEQTVDGAGAHDRSYCVTRHVRPLPRLCESWALIRAAGSRIALIDASDGLADSLVRISAASGSKLVVDLDKVPVHHETIEVANQAGEDPLDWALYGGEDYEIIGCLDRSSFEALDENSCFSEIGEVLPGEGVEIHLSGKAHGKLDPGRSFQHF